MSNFSALPIFPDNTGTGITRVIWPTVYHLNRFRIHVTAPPDQIKRYQAIAANLVHDMPKYMNSHTAAVKAGTLLWNGQKTLRFRGVAKVKPFSIPTFYNPLTHHWTELPVPEEFRDLLIPDVHTDWVGVEPGTETETGFTAQTLKRNFADGTDNLLKDWLALKVIGPDPAPWWERFQDLGELALETLAPDYLVWVNQHHFLAGRRSFRFFDGKEFGYKDQWVFETAAMERFSLLPYVASQAVMGRAEDIVRPVWVEMVRQFCKANKLPAIGDVTFSQQRFSGYHGMLNSHDGKTLGKIHLKIHP